MLMQALPPGYRTEPGHQARWLWRTMRAAELAGLDAGGVLAAAIAERDLAGARDLPAVIDARLRHGTGSLVPLPAGPWSAQVPALADPERRAYVAEIAALMNARKDRLAEHAAEYALPWAVNALGPVPEHPLDGTDVPVFGTVAEVMAATGADVSVVFVPPAGAKDAVIEAIEAQIGLCIVITEGIPVHDTAYFWARASAAGNKTRIVGPNCPGVASPGQSNAGIIPADITTAGRIGLVSKSGTLTYQMMYELRDIGFSTAVGIGGDPVIGTTHIDCLQAFQDDPETDAIVMIGEIGGDAEERAGAFIEQHVTKPVVGYVAGFTAPEGKTMGHAGAIISGSSGTAQAKKEALEKAGVRVGKTPSETAGLVRDIMRSRGQPAR